MKRMLMKAAPVIGALAWRNRSKIRRWLSERNADENQKRGPEGVQSPEFSQTDNGSQHDRATASQHA